MADVPARQRTATRRDSSRRRSGAVIDPFKTATQSLLLQVHASAIASVAPHVRLAAPVGTATVPRGAWKASEYRRSPGIQPITQPPERTRAGFRHRSLVKCADTTVSPNRNGQRLGRHTYCLIARYKTELGVQQALVNDDTEDPPSYHLRGAASCQIAT